LRLRTRKTEALLGYLALPPGQTHSRDKLASLLWGDRSLRQARSRLRESLFVLRRALASVDPPCLAIGIEAVTLNASEVDVDAVTFVRLTQIADPEALARAVGLYRGDLLEGLAFRGALFEDWLMTERERLRELVLEALARLLAHQTATAQPERAIQTAVRLLGLDPLQEAVHRTLMRLYARQGRRGRRSSSIRYAWRVCSGSWGRSRKRRRSGSIRSCCGSRPRR
jgi:DNA-binding SARP family transcriptional activator